MKEMGLHNLLPAFSLTKIIQVVISYVSLGGRGHNLFLSTFKNRD